MPGRDGTGPRGRGPMTGRGEGYCVLRIPDDPEQSWTGLAGRLGRPVTIPPGAAGLEARFLSAVDVQYTYGPVPSRRLGRSLGVDLVPQKVCTYDCVYCQLGRTTTKTIERRAYIAADAILAELELRLSTEPSPPDFIGVAGSGEPTLNSEIGRVIRGIKSLTSVPVAVLTNGSLLFMPEVQDALMDADVVLPSLDAGDADLFRRVDRPHPAVDFEKMIEGLVSFTRRYPGEVWLEVLLLAGVTGSPIEVEKIAALVRRIAPARVQLNTVSRPPSEQSARALSKEAVESLSNLFPGPVDIICDGSERREGKETEKGEQDDGGSSSLGPFGVDVVAMLRRRPCTLNDVAAGLGLHVNEALKQLSALKKAGKVTTSFVDGVVYYAVVTSTDDPKV